MLRARCHPQESVPFKALDAAIDDLTRFLSYRTADELAPLLEPNVGALTRIFPVLGRIPEVAARRAPDDGGREPQEIRRRAFRSLRDLLARVARQRPLVLWIDDLQWGDLDSLALLRALCAPPDAPRLLLLLSFRSGDEPAPVLERLFEADDAPPPRRLEVAALPDAEARALARQILLAGGGAADETTLDAIVGEAGGSAFYVCELARHAAGQGAPAAALRAESLLARRVADLPPLERRLLEVVAVAGAPIQEELLYKLSGTSDTVARALARLRADRLLRTTLLGEQTALAAYHDRVRETVARRLSREAYRSLHRVLAAALEALPDPDPLRLVEHCFEADDLARASAHAVASAERAFAALAFEQAARLYRRALELGATAPPRWVLHARLGETLANLGHGGEAGAAFLAAAGALRQLDGDAREVSRLERQAAEHYLRSGAYDDGLRALRGVLDRVGLPYLERAPWVIGSLLRNRARLWLRQTVPWQRPRRRLDGAEAERLEVCWSAGLGLGVADTLRAAEYQSRHALMAIGADDVGHEARALAIEGLLMAWEGGRRKRARAGRLRVESERLARAAANPNVEAYGLVLRTVGAFFERRLQESLARADEAETFCRDRCVGVAWELANVLTIAVSARVLLGRLVDVGRLLDATLREAREREDQYCLLMIRAGYCNLAWLAADEVDEAERQAREALSQPYPETFTWPVYQGALAETHIDLYRGDAERAGARMQRAWRRLRAGSMLRFQTVRIEMRDLRARSALLAAARPWARTARNAAAICAGRAPTPGASLEDCSGRPRSPRRSKARSPP
ncbi:MAG: AAA family ATPase [Candidatus Binatia bacterium]